MTPDRWQQVATLYEAAVEQPPANRAAFLTTACRDDAALRSEVESLLQQEGISVPDDLPGRVAADMFCRPRGLVAGAFIGAYRIIDPLGAGGMGEVYRAHDTKLDREVALKILPAEFVDDPDRLARFTRESHVLASLNHPNIAAIYGSVDSSPSDAGTPRPEALVLELVSGPTLADRIADGRLAVDEALTIARQVAEALRAAHERGVIHRDLKPANIKIRDDETVKVLDFGLATNAVAKRASLPADPHATSPASAASATPTMTRVGGVIGTPAYMSPEQAEGRTADKGSDIWAFGCVLFEMLTGQRVFSGDSVSDTIAAVLHDEPRWQALPSDLSPSIHTLLRRCLERDRKRRIADASTILFLIDEAPMPAGLAHIVGRERSIAKSMVWLTVAAACAAAIASAGWWMARPNITPGQVTRFTITLPADQQFADDTRSMMAISRDGSRLAYFASGRLHVQTMSTGESRPIAGSEIAAGVANNLSVSPDGRWIAYWDSSDRHLKKISVSGGSPVMLASPFNPLGVRWDDSGILLADPMSGELVRLSADGGDREVLVRAKEDEIIWSPQVLPDREHVLFSVGDRTAGRSASPDVVVQSIRSGERHVVIRGGSGARFVGSGHILYFADGGLFGVPFDERRLETAGERTPLIHDVRSGSGATGGFPAFDVSENGSLIYIAGATPKGGLAMIARHGGVTSLPVKAAMYEAPRLSPDGTQVAVGTAGTDANIWIADLRGAGSTRQLTLEGRNRFPVWSADGERVAFQSDRGGDVAIWWQHVDGTQPAERLTTPDANDTHTPEAWSPRDNRLLYDAARGSQHALWTLSLDDRGSSIVSDVQGSAVPIAATFSPDGRWIAYQFGSVGQDTFPSVFVRPFPLTSVKYRIAAGIHPLWSHDGKELLYNQGPSRPLAAVTVTTKPVFSWGEPRSESLAISSLESGLWFERNIDLAPDGRLIGVVGVDASAPQEAIPTQIRVVLNWFEDLRRLVPRNR
jgi:serine/threonine protein kinase/Tol biopolymer transport system component